MNQPAMKTFLVTVCPKVKMSTGQISGGDYYQIKVEATNQVAAIRKARQHFNQHRRIGEFGATFRVYSQ